MPPVVVVPIRGFRGAKRRLADVLDEPGRAEVARQLATGVLVALDGLDVIVVTSDDAAAELAAAHGALVVADPAGSLDAAAHAGRATAVARGAEAVAVVHADLPFPTELGELLRAAGTRPGATLVPDRHGDGTNVLVVPCDAAFEFAYGPGSFERHRAEAQRLGLEVVVEGGTPLSWDVDVPEDLTTPAEWGTPPWARIRCDG